MKEHETKGRRPYEAPTVEDLGTLSSLTKTKGKSGARIRLANEDSDDVNKT